jgi:hypothetical protein
VIGFAGGKTKVVIMAIMQTPAKLQNVKFNFKPTDTDTGCEACGSATDVYIVDSDWGPLSIDLCIDCIDADYDPAGNL